MTSNERRLQTRLEELDRKVLLLINNKDAYVKKSELKALLSENVSIVIEPLVAAPTQQDYNDLLIVVRTLSNALAKIKNLVS